MLLDWGVDLTLPIRKETIQGKTVFFVNEPPYDLVASFDTGVKRYRHSALMVVMAGPQLMVMSQMDQTNPEAMAPQDLLAMMGPVMGVYAILIVLSVIVMSVLTAAVYRAVGSPTVWHNPTQITVTTVSLLCVPYLMHCWCEFERQLAAGRRAITLPWRKVFWLIVLLMLAAATKPTFLQALLPAAIVLIAVQWAKQPRQWRYFMQLVLAFLPSVAYFLLQYLYYTGVVVEYTSGVTVFATAETLWIALRSVLMMGAFPLLALLLRHRKGQKVDRAVLLVLLMLLFSALEAAFFHETGLREAHGNFTWATGSSALLLWWLALRDYWNDFAAFWPARGQSRLRATGYVGCWVLLGWHALSALYYLYYLISTGNVF